MKLGHFSGEWSSEQFMPRRSVGGSVLHAVVFEPAHAGLTATSLPQEDGSELTLMLRYYSFDQILTGTWAEVLAPKEGHERGVYFEGALQLKALRENRYAPFDRSAYEGQWVGVIDKDRSARVASGRWVLKQIQADGASNS